MESVESKSPINGESIANVEREALLYAQLLSNSIVLPMTLHAAVELGVFDVVVDAGPGKYLSAKEICTKLAVVNPDASAMLDRILGLLVSYEIFSCTIEAIDDGTSITRRYGATPVCKYLAKKVDGLSLASFLKLVQQKATIESWYHLKDAVVDGGVPFERAHGMTLFEYLSKDSRMNNIFNAGMSTETTIAMDRILATYTGFQGLNTVVDVGGGVGTALNAIISKHPTIKGINFDQPHVVASGPTLPGVEHVGGDMFQSVPSGDAILMKNVLHDWTDERCVRLLENCWKALPEHGKVVLVEGILPVDIVSDATTKVTFIFDVGMMACTPGGKERSEQEFEMLGRQAGFSDFKFVRCMTNLHVMELLK